VEFLSELRDKNPSSTIAYHLEGLLEAQDNIRSLLERLGAIQALDTESRMKTLTYLQVEIYTHLAYHMKELRRPLKGLIDATYQEAPDIEQDETLQMPHLPPKGDAT